MLSAWFALSAIALYGLSGFPACLLPVGSVLGQRLATLFMLLGSLLGLGALGLSLFYEGPWSFSEAWFLPWGSFAVGLDPLGAFFLALIFVVPTLGSFYGLGYWRQTEHRENGRRLGIAYGLLAAGMATVVLARDGILFLIAWEVMALAAFFAATAEDDNPEVRKAGWVYLIATHVGTFFLFAMFALWSKETGSFALESTLVPAAGAAGVIFVLALVGFGFKAGFMPLHVWLPGAHANAPSHVSAVMSGVMLKMGIYGIVRVTSLLPVGAEWWGFLVLAVGAVTGFAGIVFALAQRDIKRLLAYSSIENIGVIGMGLGLGLLGNSWGRPDWMLLGFGAAFFHVWNHGLFKPLLFFNAGAVIYASGTREIDRLGGLGRKLPRVMILFAIGALAISALPPLNGFSSEWLLYLGLFRTLSSAGQEGAMAAAGAAGVLALIGALAVACFVKLTGAVFLGTPKSPLEKEAREPGSAMMFPMIVLALVCAGLGLFPALVVPILEGAVRSWAGQALPQTLTLSRLAPTWWISVCGLGLAALAGAIYLIFKILPRSGKAAAANTWDCGYSRPTSRMQYTGASFAQSLVRLFGFVLLPKHRTPAVKGPFPKSSRLRTSVPDPVLDRLVLPLFKILGRYAPRIRVFQGGQTQLYVLYILVIAIVLLLLGGVRV